MSRASCPQEEKISRAARAGEREDPHREHLSRCQACRETFRVATWLREVALETERTTALPGAETIWWRSQVVKKLCEQEARVERQARPLMLAQISAVALSVVTGVVLMLGSEPMAGLVDELTGLFGGSGAIVAVAVAVSVLTGGLVAWQAAQELS